MVVQLDEFVPARLRAVSDRVFFFGYSEAVLFKEFNQLIESHLCHEPRVASFILSPRRILSLTAAHGKPHSRDINSQLEAIDPPP